MSEPGRGLWRVSLLGATLAVLNRTRHRSVNVGAIGLVFVHPRAASRTHRIL